MRDVRQIHFVGIGGAGMSGLAEVFNNLGYTVSGSDLNANKMTAHLASVGVSIFKNHKRKNISGADVVVYSSAIPKTNVELLEAQEQRIPTVPRAEMLAELMRFKRGIAVAGTHGKTTTTSLVASILAEGGMDPTFVIGGLVHAVNSHARLGSGDFLVAEADESDTSFLLLNPLIAVLTNIDADHMGTYDGDFGKLRATFVEFFKRLPFYGVAIVCIDDPVVHSLLPELRTRVVTYGTHVQADVRGIEFHQQGPTSSFKVIRRNPSEVLSVRLTMPGEHNMLNSLAAIAVAFELRIPCDTISDALSSFQGIGRRCQWMGETQINGAEIAVIDDYAHHPSELRVTIKAVRGGWPDRRLLVVFQPHRYSRTRDLFEDFVEVLNTADALVVLEVYPAGEDPIPGADGRSLCRAIRQRGQVDPVFLSDTGMLDDVLKNIARTGDLLLLSGAGSISRVADGMTFGVQTITDEQLK
ncbi:MAG TPA: UDP-N-acetylmuramate--L-alanine ligase [Gammaproteobacteria bacterium]|nr:UDP-N-acetylmuramate--L-alanine ligase [Gammaproteobacteria bacterium]